MPRSFAQYMASSGIALVTLLALGFIIELGGQRLTPLEFIFMPGYLPWEILSRGGLGADFPEVYSILGVLTDSLLYGLVVSWLWNRIRRPRAGQIQH